MWTLVFGTWALPCQSLHSAIAQYGETAQKPNLISGKTLIALNHIALKLHVYYFFEGFNMLKHCGLGERVLFVLLVFLGSLRNVLVD